MLDTENVLIKAVKIKLKLFMEPCVSCIYLTYIVWNVCENLNYESAYFKSYTMAKNTIDRQYTERGQL